MDTVLHNPIKMDRIRGMIAKDLQEKELSKKVKKEAKKQAKKDKKTAKKERKKRDRSPSDSRYVPLYLDEL